MGRVCVVIPAAGGGTRMGGQSKQFRLMGGAPLLYQTLRAFERHKAIHHMIVVVPADTIDRAASMLRGMRKLAGITAGGATRQASVSAGVKLLPKAVDIVLVHDAARPFIEAPGISDVIAAATCYGAAALAIPVADTVRYAKDGFFTRDVSRSNLFAVQTPQGFTRTVLAEAFRACHGDAEATDEVALVRACGRAVCMVAGQSCNFKITTREDWRRAERLWPAFARRNYGSS